MQRKIEPSRKGCGWIKCGVALWMGLNAYDLYCPWEPGPATLSQSTYLDPGQVVYWDQYVASAPTGWAWVGVGPVEHPVADGSASPRLVGPGGSQFGSSTNLTSTYSLTYPSSGTGYFYSVVSGTMPSTLPTDLSPGDTWTYYYDTGTAIVTGQATVPYPAITSTSSSATADKFSSDLRYSIQTAQSITANQNELTTNSFRFTSAFTPRTNAKQRSTWEHALHALEASGPLNLVKGQTRVWLCGYKSGGRVQTLPSNPGYHSSNVGALMGSEYRSLKDQWTVGLLLGTVVGKQTQATVRETYTNSKGINYGVYGSFSPVDGLRFDAVLTNLNMVLNHQRYDPASNQTAYAKYKMNTLIGDVMASYTWKLPHDYSVRFNVGNTYVGNHADGFTESGASVNFMQKSSTLRTHEVYGGLGLRKGWMVDKLLWRLTGSYEIGRQYYHKGRSIEVSYLGGNPITITNGPLRINHYLNANLSVLQEAIGLKGVLAYTATLSPKAKTQGKSIRQMVSVKCELRF